jgi:threonine/homoserine/homoserine lactone efflux protein
LSSAAFLRRRLARGRRAGLVAALGCTLGIVPHRAAAVVGLAALLDASSTAFQTIKFAGVAESALDGVAACSPPRPRAATRAGMAPPRVRRRVRRARREARDRASLNETNTLPRP